MARSDPNSNGIGEAPALDERGLAMERARAFIESGDYPEAERALAAMTGTDDASFDAFRLLNHVLLLQHKIEEALAVARDAARRFPGIAGGRTALAETLMKAHKLEDAVELLAEACDDFPNSAYVRFLHGKASLLLGATEQALESLSKACELAPQSVTQQLWKCVALAAAGQTGQATEMFQRLSAHSKVFETIFTSLFTRRSKTEYKADMLGLAEFAVTQLPNSASLRVHLASILMESNCPERALAQLDTISKEAADALSKSIAYRAFEIRAATMEALGNLSGTIAALEEMHQICPEYPIILKRLYLLALKTGRTAEARSFGRRFNILGAKTLPADLARALEEVRANSEPVPETTTGLDWAWEIADHRAWDRVAWRRAIDRGMKARELMLRVWLTDATRSTEIDALFAPFDSSALDALPRDTGCLIAGSHLGPTAAGTHFATTTGRRFRIFGVAGPEAIVGDGPPLRIPSDSNISRSLREILREFSSGGMVAFAADMPKKHDKRHMEFLGRKISFSLLAPQLIWKCRVPSLWWQPLWKNGRIVMEIERLPDPKIGDTFEAWLERWSAAYLGRLEKVMRGDPENLNLPKGIWQNADPLF